VAKDPAFLFYPGDWLGGTMGMTFEEKGAYFELLIFQFNCGAFSEAQAKQVLSICSASVFHKVIQKFSKNGNLYFNKRLAEEIEKRKKFSESRRNNAKSKKLPESTPKKDKAYAQHMEDENENRIESKDNNVKESFDEKFLSAFDEITCENYKRTFRGIDLGAELQKFKTKCDNDQKTYGERDVGGLRTAFQYQLNNIKQNGNGKHKSGNLKDSFDRIDEIIDQQNNP